MNISGIVLHPAAGTQLDNFLAAPTHAVLLAGPTGTGKTSVAAELAAHLLGISRTVLENNAYYRVIAPENGSISIEQIRGLLSFFRLKVPGTGAVKRVAVLQDADTMGIEAQNALLKLLEEPPADSVLILTSSQPERLLPTIRSRVQILHLPAPDASQLREFFMASGHSETAVRAALLRAGTNTAEAEHLLNAGGAISDTPVELVKQALGGSGYDRLLLVDGLAKQKENARAFADALATVALVSLESAAAKGAATLTRWQAILQAAHTAQNALERSGNTKLVLTELMLVL